MARNARLRRRSSDRPHHRRHRRTPRRSKHPKETDGPHGAPGWVLAPFGVDEDESVVDGVADHGTEVPANDIGRIVGALEAVVPGEGSGVEPADLFVWPGLDVRSFRIGGVFDGPVSAADGSAPFGSCRDASSRIDNEWRPVDVVAVSGIVANTPATAESGKYELVSLG